MPDDLNNAVRQIVARAIRDLVKLGMEPEGAAALLAVQGIIRIVAADTLEQLRGLIDDGLASDDDDETTPV